MISNQSKAFSFISVYVFEAVFQNSNLALPDSATVGSFSVNKIEKYCLGLWYVNYEMGF